MQKIKVLQFPITNSKSGVAQYILKNWEFIDKSKFQFDFATLNKELDFGQELISQGCKVHYISCYGEQNEEQFIKEINGILDEDYDVIHLHTSFWKSFLVEELAIKHKVPKIIVHSHSTMIDILNDKKRESAIEIHNLRKKQFSTSLATDFCACSSEAAEWLFGDEIPKDKIRIMKNAIEVDKFLYNENKRNEYRKNLGLENYFVLGNVGRFVYQKNHDMLIEIFNIVSKNIENAKLILIGIGPLEKAIVEKVKKYGLEKDVIFMGKRSDVDGLMQAMDLFLLPSRFEGLPIVLIEAQAAGMKCLASSVISKEVKITDNIEFLPFDIKSWSEKIIDYSKGYNREIMHDSITRSGYNINYEIKELENLYYGLDRR